MDEGRLITMANQIARNFAAQGEHEAVAATADHLAKYWDPRMKAQLFAYGGEGLTPIAAQALALLRATQAP